MVSRRPEAVHHPSLAGPARADHVGTTGGGPAAAAPPAAVPMPPAPALQWGPCADDVDPEFECATMTVPLDYANPTGQQIGIAVIRLPAASGRREGAVLLNPGGPGGSGYDFAANASAVLDRELGLDGRFDLVGFDPRGVDRSGGLRCQTDAEIDVSVYFDDTPDSPEEAAQLDALDRAFGAACMARYGDTLRHYSTDNTARDMDMIRAGLGDPQISYLGISYGTFLGAIYATLFPGNVRAMVLDSASERTGETSLQGTVTQLGGFEGAFNNWAAWCEEGTECAFSDLDVAARWDRLYASLDARPVKSDRGQAVNQVVLMTATIASMYNELSWPALGTALAEAESGDGTALLALSDEYNGRREDGTYETIFQANPVISCASGLQQPDPRDPAVLLAELQAAAPRFSRGIGISDMRDTCLDFLAQNPLPTIPSYAGTAPVLVVGGLNDPATPFRWAEEMTAMMGPSAVLLTFTGEGHGQVLSSNCVTEIEGDGAVGHAAATAGRLVRPRPGRAATGVLGPDPGAAGRRSARRGPDDRPGARLAADGDVRRRVVPHRRSRSRRSGLRDGARGPRLQRAPVRHDHARRSDGDPHARAGQHHRGTRRHHPAGRTVRGRRLRRGRPDRACRPGIRDRPRVPARLSNGDHADAGRRRRDGVADPVEHRVPQIGADSVRLRRRQPIDRDDAVDHVGHDRRPRATLHPDRDRAALGGAPHRAVEPDGPRRGAKARRREPVRTRHPGENLGGVGEHHGGRSRRAQRGRLLHVSTMTEQLSQSFRRDGGQTRRR